MNIIYFVTNCSVYLLVPVAVGWLTGWLVGASQSPVVGTTIPLVFGLLTAVGFGVVGAVVRRSSIVDAVRSVELSDDIKSKIEDEIRAGITPTTTIFASVGVIVFCIFFYIGTLEGIAQRVPTYPPLAETFETITLEPEEISHLYILRMTLASRGVGLDEYNSVINDLCKPIITRKYPGKSINERRIARRKKLQSELSHLISWGQNASSSADPAAPKIEEAPAPPIKVPVPAPKKA